MSVSSRKQKPKQDEHALNFLGEMPLRENGEGAKRELESHREQCQSESGGKERWDGSISGCSAVLSSVRPSGSP